MSKASLPEHQPASAPPRRKQPSTGMIMLIVFGSVVLFCGLCMAAGFIGKSILHKPNENIAAGPKPAVAVSAPAEEASPSTAVSTATPQRSGTGPQTSFGDGTWLVGTDILPGEYKARVPADSVGCNWARLASTDGSADGILASGVSEPGAQAVITIEQGDNAFHTQDCGTWEKV